MKNILLIEDDVECLKDWEIRLTRFLNKFNLNIVCTTSVGQAKLVFPTEKWDAIVFDGCIGGNDFNSPDLIREMRKTATCPMIAASSNPDLIPHMREAGCDYEVEKKVFVPQRVARILNPFANP